jgi:hypothetical protein
LDTGDKTITISGSSNGSGYSTIVGTEAEYTETIGGTHFQFGSDCSFTSVASRPSDIMGTWDSMTYIISDKFINFTFGYLIGEIVNVRNLGNDDGYITFKYIENSADSTLIGQYCVLYWENYVSDTSVDIAMACTSGEGDEGKPTLAEAETAYTYPNVTYFATDPFTKD